MNSDFQNDVQPFRKGDIMNKKTSCNVWPALSSRPAGSSGCSKKEETNEATARTVARRPSPAATPIDPSTVASVSGTVKFDGAAPKARRST